MQFDLPLVSPCGLNFLFHVLSFFLTQWRLFEASSKLQKFLLLEFFFKGALLWPLQSLLAEQAFEMHEAPQHGHSNDEHTHIHKPQTKTKHTYKKRAVCFNC